MGAMTEEDREDATEDVATALSELVDDLVAMDIDDREAREYVGKAAVLLGAAMMASSRGVDDQTAMTAAVGCMDAVARAADGRAG